MQLFPVKKCSALCCLVLFLSTSLISTSSHAEDLHSIHIEWAYEVSGDTSVNGFYLYKGNSIICESEDSTDRTMNCIFESAPGTFDFYLSAYSENGESPLSAPFPFTLNEIVPPVVEINSDTSSGNLPVTATLSAETLQGSVTRYHWSFGDGTADTWTTENHVTHTYYITDQYTATVTARDINYNTDTKSLTINVSPQDLPSGVTAPTANIRSSISSGAGPFSVSFDGLASTTANGEISQCIWNFDDNSQIAWGETAVHTYSIPGIYHPTLTVIDSQGIVHSSSVTIVVTDPPSDNNRPTAGFTWSLVQQNESLTLDFDASPSKDTDGQIQSYVWNFGNSAFETGSQVTHTFPVNRVHTISLTVTDDSGLQHTTSMNTITFLKDIHAAVVSHINSILLKRDTPPSEL